MALRALIVYIAALVMVRLGEKRFLGKNTAFDVILGIILGSVVSRAINGSAGFWSTLGAGFVLVGLHWLFAVLAFHSDWFGTLIKGRTRLLVKNGEIRWTAMRKSNISQNDLLGALRSEARTSSPDEVKEAHLERSGNISVIRANQEPKILEVTVREGVQTIRIQIE
ncbi:MAG: DUF421 domain-containing protein [Anaerolineae bacterium]|nr:DUF421 domain-containing protein [Anaerolineae bacterium]